MEIQARLSKIGGMSIVLWRLPQNSGSSTLPSLTGSSFFWAKPKDPSCLTQSDLTEKCVKMATTHLLASYSAWIRLCDGQQLHFPSCRIDSLKIRLSERCYPVYPVQFIVGFSEIPELLF